MIQLVIYLRQLSMLSSIKPIDDEEISFAEKILLNSGKFDSERRNFIRDLSTLDLHAVPGSGKTTALLAKLLILEKRLPFRNGEGILVLSHTNSAINSIKDRIGPFCPNLFKYPNFVGTIQSFVDDFLAKPYFTKLYNRKVFKIDDQIYEDATKWINLKHGTKYYLSDLKHLEFHQLRFDKDRNILKSINGEVLLRASGNSKVYNDILSAKEGILQKGVLHFDDAYYFAERYIHEAPIIKSILQKRFMFVFVDEMQDMENHQINILEELFYNETCTYPVYQRIGDSNQAIYNDIDHETEWKTRAKKLTILGSHRLTQVNADIVKWFGLSDVDIIGKSSIKYDQAIKPCILRFDDDSKKCKVVIKFIELVKNYQKQGLMPESFKHPIKVISWCKDRDDYESKLCLKSYCPCFNKELVKQKVLYTCFEQYLYCYNKADKSFNAIRKNILNAIIHILRCERIYQDPQKSIYFTKKTLIKYVQERYPEEYKQFQLKLFQWCKNTIYNRQEMVINEIRDYVPYLINLTNQKKEELSKSVDFLFTPFNLSGANEPIQNEEKCQNCMIGDQLIEMNSVHSSKGETHTATLYLESFYDRKYEIERLVNQFLQIDKLPESPYKRISQSAKMIYVGFSRATHFLCFAVHKNRFNANLTGINESVWNVLDV